MPRKRTQFSESDKALIFCRDRATCCFTGACLWILDRGAVRTWLGDWADHEIPVARGGKSKPSNGVCASWKANQRKSANGRDHQYWFREGQATSHFVEEVGLPDTALVERLRRLSHLQPSDWYLNRAIYNLFLGFEKRYWPDQWERQSEHYFKASLRFLTDWNRVVRKDKDQRSLEARGVLLRPLSNDMRLLLSLRSVESLDDLERIADKVGPIYRANCNAFHAFITAATSRGRQSAIARAATTKLVSSRVVRSMKQLDSVLDSKCGKLLRD